MMSLCPCPTSTWIYLGNDVVQTLAGFIFLFCCCFVFKISDGFSICLKLRNYVQSHVAGLCLLLLERHLVVCPPLPPPSPSPPPPSPALTMLCIVCPCHPGLISMPLGVSEGTTGLPWLLAQHLKTALCKGLQNVTYTHKYMQCRCPILFYFGSENDYVNLENMSTSGALNSRQAEITSLECQHVEEEGVLTVSSNIFKKTKTCF